MIQKHVALISPESPTTQGGQGSNTHKVRESRTDYGLFHLTKN